MLDYPLSRPLWHHLLSLCCCLEGNGIYCVMQTSAGAVEAKTAKAVWSPGI